MLELVLGLLGLLSAHLLLDHRVGVLGLCCLLLLLSDLGQVLAVALSANFV